MTTRAFSPDDLVVLPRLDAHEAVALAASLAAAAAGEGPLPVVIATPLAKIAEHADVLTRELGPAATTPEGVGLAAADRAEDNAVGALEEFLSSWARLPEDIPGASTGAKVHAAIFGDAGLGFLKLKAKLEWAQVEVRLKRFDDRALAADLDAIGGTPFLTHLRATHEAYGVAAGVTHVAPVAETAKVRAAYDALTAAVRRYVVRVSSSVDDASPRSEARADALLAPLTNWVSAPVTKAAAPAPVAPTPPTA